MPWRILGLFFEDFMFISASILDFFWQVFKNWWWLPLPFILWWPFIFLWLWWRADDFLKKQDSILLEIRMPKDIVKPVRAMENVFSALRQVVYDPGEGWEKWIEGKIQLSLSFEIASIDGEPHFFIRIPKSIRDSAEAAIYSQYPEAEVFVAPDYTKNVPQNIPNKEWDLWGADYKLLRPDPYPIKTYFDFETEREAVEEKRIDPLANLLESMTKIGKGEQVWIQILISPVTNKQLPWITEGEKIRDEIAKRTGPFFRQKPMLLEAADVLIMGEVPKKPEKEKEVIPPEMKLTPGEREVISAVEKKISKPGYKANIRFIYLGKRDVFFKPRLRLVFGYFGSYVTENLNALVPYGQPLMTKIKKTWFLPLNIDFIFNKRLYMRQRKLFKKYVRRFTPFFPRPGATFILNVEELASLYHFPGREMAAAPFVPRIESKKGEAPPGLPTE